MFFRITLVQPQQGSETSYDHGKPLHVYENYRFNLCEKWSPNHCRWKEKDCLPLNIWHNSNTRIHFILTNRCINLEIGNTNETMHYRICKKFIYQYYRTKIKNCIFTFVRYVKERYESFSYTMVFVYQCCLCFWLADDFVVVENALLTWTRNSNIIRELTRVSIIFQPI